MKNRLEKLSIANTTKFETEMKEHEETLNTKIDTRIDDLKYESSISINKTLYPLNSKNDPSFYN